MTVAFEVCTKCLVFALQRQNFGVNLRPKFWLWNRFRSTYPTATFSLEPTNLRTSIQCPDVHLNAPMGEIRINHKARFFQNPG